MGFDQILKRFMPREERFQDLFAKDAENLLRASRLFKEIADSDSLEQRRVKTVQMKALEHEGDKITRQIFEALNSTFITPLDREDIRALGSDLDDIVDHLESVAQYLVMFDLAESPDALRQFGEILVHMAEQVQKSSSLVWDLSHAAGVHDSIVRISELENQADALYNTVIADLFRNEKGSPVHILKWKEVYDGLEDACDGCKDFSHILGNIVLKNA